MKVTGYSICSAILFFLDVSGSPAFTNLHDPKTQYETHKKKQQWTAGIIGPVLQEFFLVGGWTNPSQKYAQVKNWIISLNRDEN